MRLIQVQRITDGFEGFQFSHVPGLYPIRVDASGCKREEVPKQQSPKQIVITEPVVEQQTTQSHYDKRAAVESKPRPQESHLEGAGRAQMGNAMRESLSDKSTMPAGQTYATAADQVQVFAKCDHQGLIPSICITFFEDI